MERGWDATGRLAPIYKRVGGRDQLARLTGIEGTTLSLYNSGKRNIGLKNARRIADAANVTLVDLGAPDEAAATDDQQMFLQDRLEELATALAEAVERQETMGKEVRSLRSRIRKLEAAHVRGEAEATGRP